ncbi:MAG TPA: GGDEF domain-containing protein [Nevskia sp.]|jgi:diguanylate cyclase (GGDEF)-like protein|nr:GGDEF domain-containing protein [Nevskia sp.]
MQDSRRTQHRKHRRRAGQPAFGQRPAGAPAGARRDLPPQDVQLLESIASSTTRRYHFPPALEREFQEYVRIATRTARVCLALLTFGMFALAPLWIRPLLGEPEGMAAPMHLIELGIMAPLFALVAWVQWRYVAHDASEWLLLAAFLGEAVCLEVIVRLADGIGYALQPSLGVVVPLSVIILARLRIMRCLLFVAGYFAVAVGFALAWPARLNLRLPSGWMLEILLLAIALLSAAWSKLSFRRQWAANLLLSLMAYRDSVTGLPNRRALDDQYDIIRRAPEAGRRLVFALVDLDHFKLVNDTYGHEYGDGVLAEVGLTLAQFAGRALDAAARVGGEEFALILHDCDSASGRERLEQVLQGVRALGIEHRGQDSGVVTCSIGAAVIDPRRPLQVAYRAADECLYRAKNAGRDRLEMVEV